MAKHEGRDVTILRVAGPNDPGFDPRYPKVYIGAEHGEVLVLRRDLDESEDMSDEQREELERAMGKSDEQIRVDDIRRDARARGAPPDQTPDPNITLPSGRIVPNPDADPNAGRAPTLEQDKAPIPTHPTAMQAGRLAIQDRGDPTGGMPRDPNVAKSEDEARKDQAQKAEEAQKRLAEDKDQREKDADARRHEQKAREDQTASSPADGPAAAPRSRDGGDATVVTPPQPTPSAPPPGTPEGLGEDQRRDRGQAQGNTEPAV